MSIVEVVRKSVTTVDVAHPGVQGVPGAVDSVNSRTGAVVLTSADVGLANVNNTSDANKPVSTAQAAADAAVLASANATTAAHATRTDNPHTVTAAQLGLGNVENKSSATIRSEITSGNVTTALGYTPASASSNTGDETGPRIGTLLHAATAKTTPVDADEVTGLDSAASFGLIRMTWANVKATLKTYFDTVYQAVLGANFSWDQTNKRLTLTGANVTNSRVFLLANCGAGTGVMRAEWGAGGYYDFGDAGGKADLSVTNHKGLNFLVRGTGDAAGIFTFDADANAISSGGPLLAFHNNSVRKAELHTDGRYSSYGAFTDASNYERGTFKVDTTNGLTITHEALGTGATRGVNINFGASARLSINAVGVRCDAPLYPNTAAQSLGLSSNYWGTAFLTVAKMNVFTVATLPSAATSGAGTRSFVSDALAPTFGATVAAGGAVNTPVYSDGTNWKVG